MFKLILNSLKNPILLLQATMIPKKIIRRFILQLTLITAIPSLIFGIQTLTTVQQDLQTIATKAPQFQTQDGLLTSSDHQKSFAIQTDSTYFLYDIENTVSQHTIHDMTQQHFFNIILTKTNLSIYGMSVQLPIQNINFSKNSIFTTLDFKNILYDTKQALNLFYILIPILVIIIQLIYLLFMNLIFTLISNTFFRLMNKRVRWNHLWRVSFLASLMPYLIFTLFNMFNVTVPFENFIMSIYIVATQYLVVREAL